MRGDFLAKYMDAIDTVYPSNIYTSLQSTDRLVMCPNNCSCSVSTKSGNLVY